MANWVSYSYYYYYYWVNTIQLAAISYSGDVVSLLLVSSVPSLLWLVGSHMSEAALQTTTKQLY